MKKKWFLSKVCKICLINETERGSFAPESFECVYALKNNDFLMFLITALCEYEWGSKGKDLFRLQVTQTTISTIFLAAAK